MALKLNERYPGRFDNPSADYPQGSFKNRTTPTAKDGSYLEKDWANDKEGFFQSLLSESGIVADGDVDKVGASQYYDALSALFGSGRRINTREFKTPGEYVYTPTPGTTKIIVRCVGGGGAGCGAPATGAGVASAGAPGGSGSYAVGVFTTGFSGVTITVGAGGVGNLGFAGTAGSASSVGALISAPGGGAGIGYPGITQIVASSAAGGGLPSGGNLISAQGNRGTQTILLSSTVGGVGSGGNSFFGGAIGRGGDGALNTPSSAATTGASGGAGIVLIEEYT
ncbi:hypothetical protein [Pseudomonas rhizophila]